MADDTGADDDGYERVAIAMRQVPRPSELDRERAVRYALAEYDRLT